MPSMSSKLNMIFFRLKRKIYCMECVNFKLSSASHAATIAGAVIAVLVIIAAIVVVRVIYLRNRPV